MAVSVVYEYFPQGENAQIVQSLRLAFNQLDGVDLCRNSIFTAFDEGEPVAYALAQEHECNLVLSFLEVAKNRRHEKIAKNLLLNVFAHAKNRARQTGVPMVVVTDGFTKDGRAHLLPLLKKFGQEFEGVTYETAHYA